MKIVLSYGYNANASLIEKTKNYLSKGAEGNLMHEVRIDTSDFKAGKRWREGITKGAFESAVPSSTRKGNKTLNIPHEYRTTYRIAQRYER